MPGPEGEDYLIKMEFKSDVKDLKVGTRVRIKKYDAKPSFYPTEMDNYKGRMGVVDGLEEDKSNYRVLFPDGERWWYYPEHLEIVTEVETKTDNSPAPHEVEQTTVPEKVSNARESLAYNEGRIKGVMEMMKIITTNPELQHNITVHGMMWIDKIFKEKLLDLGVEL